MQSKGQQKSESLAPDGLAAAETAQFKVLIVDGHFFLSDFVEKFLETEGHLVLKAASAEEALTKTSQFQPDLILLDNGLEGVTGLELLGELLMEQTSAAVILLARNPTIAEAVEAIKLGATDYIAGPLDPQNLKQAIEAQKALFKKPTQDEGF